MNEINDLKIKINELENTIKEAGEKKNIIYEKVERSRIFALRSTIFSAILIISGYFIHPIVTLTGIMCLGITVPIGGISMLSYENKEDKYKKVLDMYTKELDCFKEKLEELTNEKGIQIPATKKEIIIPKQIDNKIKKSR